MKKRRRYWIATILATILVAIASFLIQPKPDRIFHGRPESDWISGVRYFDEMQLTQWREFGPEGVQVLVRGLEKANHPWERRYRQSYRKIPQILRRILPEPKFDYTRSKRMDLVALLSLLGNDAKDATPIMIQTLKDEDAAVRSLAVSFFTGEEDQSALLNQLDKAQKQKLLPIFLAETKSHYAGLRNNTLIALRYYAEEKQSVTPAIIPLLKDPKPEIRLCAVETLHCVNPDQLVASGAVAVAMDMLKNPDDQLASRSARILGEMRKEPAMTIPALLDAVRGTNGLVADISLRALAKFPEEAETIIPALQEILRTNNGQHYRSITNLLQKLGSSAPRSVGGK